MIKTRPFIAVAVFFYISNLFAQDQYINFKDVTQTPVLSFCKNKGNHDKNCFKRSLQNYIASKLVLPYDSLNKPIEGNVKVYLIFSKEGDLVIKATRSKNKVLQTQAKNLFDGFPKFKPALVNGSDISMALVFPLQYSFSAKTNRFYSIQEVEPPQVKNYKKGKTKKELRRLYRVAISNFIIQSGYKYHDIKGNTKMILITCEVDSLGKVSNFHDLIQPNPKKEANLNKQALKKLSFKIPPRIHGIPVKVKDTIELIGVERKVTRKSLGYSTQVIKGYPNSF